MRCIASIVGVLVDEQSPLVSIKPVLNAFARPASCAWLSACATHFDTKQARRLIQVHTRCLFHLFNLSKIAIHRATGYEHAHPFAIHHL